MIYFELAKKLLINKHIPIKASPDIKPEVKVISRKIVKMI
jgi:hypothetical protein